MVDNIMINNPEVSFPTSINHTMFNTNTPKNPIFLAIDYANFNQAEQILSQTHEHIGGYKIGLEFFCANGAEVIADLKLRYPLPLFLDLKLHDIPETVRKAIISLADIAPYMLTVHASGGFAMLQAAMDASMEIAYITGKERPMVLAVTTLTSLDDNDLRQQGIADKVDVQVRRMAELAYKAGIDGVVCSAHEAGLIDDELSLIKVVPGIKLAEQNNHQSQKRTATPQEAMTNGADYLVIGRTISGSENPASIAQQIAADIG